MAVENDISIHDNTASQHEIHDIRYETVDKSESFESDESLINLFQNIASGQFQARKSLSVDEDTQVNTQPIYYMVCILLLFLLFRIHFIKR